MGVACSVHDASNLRAALEHPTIWTVYIRDLEHHILEETRKYYRLYGETCLAQSADVSSYLLTVRDAREQEVQRCSRYFPPRTTALVSSILLHEMVTMQEAFLVDGIVPYMESLFNDHLVAFHVHNVDEMTFESVRKEFTGLKNMYDLFVRTAETSGSSSCADTTDSNVFLCKLVDGLHLLARLMSDSLLASHSLMRKGMQRSPGEGPYPTASPMRQQAASNVSAQTSSTSSSVFSTPRGSGKSTPSGSAKGAKDKATPSSSQKIKQVGLKVTEDVTSVVSLLDSIVQLVFDGHMLFVKAVQKAFKYIVNFDCDDMNCVDLYAGYCDNMIKVGGV